MTIAVSYHDTASKLQDFTRFARGPFDRPAWYALLERDGLKPVFAVAENGSDRVALPLVRTRQGMASLTNWFTFTWRHLGENNAATRKLLTHLAADLRGNASFAELSPLPDEDGSCTLLAASFRHAGWLVFREQCDENHVLPIGNRSFANYWAARPGPLRTTVKRKAKKVDVEILPRFDERTWGEYRRVYDESWKPAEERADILEDFARAEGDAGRLRLGVAYHAGKPVAAQFWTVEHGTAYIHKLAHTQAAQQLSAGTVLSAAMFEYVMETDRVDLIDFGTGSDAYKADWMDRIRPRFRLTCYDWRNPRTWPAIARAALRRLAPPSVRG